jgi:hypothetical protein
MVIVKHRLNAYKDGYKWIAFCENCGQEQDELTQECPGDYNVTYFKKKEKFVSGLQDKD